MTIDPVEAAAETEIPRQTFELEETGFREVPKKWRKYYRHWQGPGDRLYCMPCMSRLIVVEAPDGGLTTEVRY